MFSTVGRKLRLTVVGRGLAFLPGAWPHTYRLPRQEGTRKKGDLESRPSDASCRSMSKFKYTCARSDVWCHQNYVRNMDPVDWKMKAKRYSGSTSLGNYAAMTKAGAAINSTLPDQLWAFFVGIRYPCFFYSLRPVFFLRQCRAGVGRAR